MELKLGPWPSSSLARPVSPAPGQRRRRTDDDRVVEGARRATGVDRRAVAARCVEEPDIAGHVGVGISRAVVLAPVLSKACALTHGGVLAQSSLADPSGLSGRPRARCRAHRRPGRHSNRPTGSGVDVDLKVQELCWGSCSRHRHLATGLQLGQEEPSTMMTVSSLLPGNHKCGSWPYRPRSACRGHHRRPCWRRHRRAVRARARVVEGKRTLAHRRGIGTVIVGQPWIGRIEGSASSERLTVALGTIPTAQLDQVGVDALTSVQGELKLGLVQPSSSLARPVSPALGQDEPS